MTQVTKQWYDFEKYVDKLRWSSYYAQIVELNKILSEEKEAEILYIGKGDGIVPLNMEHIFGRRAHIYTCDFAEDLAPDYVCDIRNITNVIDKKFDIIFCCQVLEHIEWNDFSLCIQQLSQICRGKIVISLPQRKRCLSVIFRNEREVLNFFLPCLSFEALYYKVKKWKFNGEHYWEANTKGMPKRKIREEIQKYFQIENEYTLVDNPYHWFIIGAPKHK